MSGAAGSPGDWNEPCGGVTMNGRCVGDVYQWCDFFSRTVSELDCAALGMRCEAEDIQWYEDELNGCVGDPCTSGAGSCDGAILEQCLQGEMHARDCRKKDGPSSLCTSDGESFGCTPMACDRPNRERCEGSIAVTCDEDGQAGLIDCKRCDLSGQCIADPNDVSIGGTYCDVPTMGCEM
jgi:hypothetical protein